MNRSSTITVLLALPVLAFLAVFYAFPLGTVLALGVWDQGLTLKYLAQALGNTAYLHVLLWTVQMALVTAIVCLVLGYPIAHTLVRATPRVQAILFAMIILPFWTSSLVRAYAWITLLGRGGLVNQALLGMGVIDEPLKLVFNAIGLYVGSVHIMLPYMIFSLYATMRSVDVNLSKAAETLGAGPLRAFCWVYLPLSMPGIIAGFTLVFMITLGFFITPALLGGLRDATFVMIIEKQVNEVLNWPLAAALSTVLLVITLLLYWAFNRSVETPEGRDAGRRIAGADAMRRAVEYLDRAIFRPLRSRLRDRNVDHRRKADDALGWRAAASPVRLATYLIVAALVVPIVIIVVVAFSPTHNLEFPPSRLSLQWFEKYFTRTEWLAATRTSFEVAALACGFATVLAVFATYAVLRAPRSIRALALGFLLSPMIVPVMVYAVGAYYQFAAMGLLGTKLGLALAHTVLALPPALVVILPAVQGLDEAYDRAAASLGANAWRRFRYVALPLLRPAVLSGALLAFLTSFDEVVSAIFLSGSRAVTLPKKMYESVRFDTDPTITAASALLIGLTIVILLACMAMWRQSMHRGLRST